MLKKIKEAVQWPLKISFQAKAWVAEFLVRLFGTGRGLEQPSHIYIFLEGTQFAAVIEIFEQQRELLRIEAVCVYN